MVIREGLRVDPLLLHVERSQLRWLGNLVGMPPGRLPGFLGRSHQEEAQRKSQDTLQELCFLAGLGTPWYSPCWDPAMDFNIKLRYTLFWKFQNKLHRPTSSNSQANCNSGVPMMPLVE
ncbi:hypothetical protein CHARACLAT_001674 [Characodon lateralis]|uniref:Uncharacterized protein n=1 Tax=Characodon lateralis TaxID=208331 RepID=A0ABU7E954_9TELE|nr:hypothetical protein [Characodon lateralis]